MQLTSLVVLFATMILAVYACAAETPFQSHPPLRQLDWSWNRPMAQGPGFFVDPARGDDRNAGSQDMPWRTIMHALDQLRPGDTLYLRNGVYYEHVQISLIGREDAPITIRAFPNERPIIDGSMCEFTESPADAWEPFDGGAKGEFRSKKRYANIRDVIGCFGDSMVGLQTYWTKQDFRAEQEFWEKDKDANIIPVWCGPGVMYDRETGYIHARLAHTNVPFGMSFEYSVKVDFDPKVSNYRGETDPRKVPLVLAQFTSVPLLISRAEHVKVQDLTFRGGGYDVVVMRQSQHVEFDNVTIHAGTYALRGQGSSHIKFYRSALYGNIAPWMTRDENSLRTYRPDPDPYLNTASKNPRYKGRDISRLPGHALLVTEGREESDVYFFPLNSDWEISYSEFTDCHDGVYLTGMNMRFHHNRIDAIHDDAMFLSTPTNNATDNIFIHENLITRSLMAFSLAGRIPTTAHIYWYRNIVDLREPVNFEKPKHKDDNKGILSLNAFKIHPDVENMYVYQNTFIEPAQKTNFAGASLRDLSPIKERRVFNNLFVYLNDYGGYRPGKDEADANLQIDHNLHWSPGKEVPGDFFNAIRNAPGSKGKWETNSLAADPKFTLFNTASPRDPADFSLQSDSPAKGRGAILPTEWPDPMRPASGNPDIGAIPIGSKMPAVGRKAGR